MSLPSPQPLIRAITLRLLGTTFFLCAVVAAAYYLATSVVTNLTVSRNTLLFGCLFLLFFGLLQIRMIQASVVRWWRLARATTTRKPAQKKSSTKVDPRKERRHDQRMMLHMLALLQRKGRLVDFLEEDLSAYDDAQIGMAVRTIQENCKLALLEQLHPEAIVDGEEETEVTIAAGFDPNAIKLVGNVVGEPPFTGILRHKGWRATGVEIPALSDRDDPLVIAPAEVEIV
ncbi:MAG: DUF2760 domain-containing protein [Desulfosarcinaceae bacterium]|nr:DUF2760 domain-containing protein [Desulfosarcinaceae bacterium]